MMVCNMRQKDILQQTCQVSTCQCCSVGAGWRRCGHGVCLRLALGDNRHCSLLLPTNTSLEDIRDAAAEGHMADRARRAAVGEGSDPACHAQLGGQAGCEPQESDMIPEHVLYSLSHQPSYDASS